jgi:hypothetical protein
MTIKEFAKGYFVKTNFTDIHGRNIGYDYSYILEKIKEQFPNSKTSRDWVRKMASELNLHTKMPIRGRRNRGTAHAYAMSLLLKRGGPHAHRNVATAVKTKFPEHSPSAATLRRLERRLRYLNFTIPPRA